MNTKFLCCSVAALALTATVAFAAPRHDRVRAPTQVRTATPSITTRPTATAGGTTRTHFRDRTVVFLGSGLGFGFPYYGFGSPYYYPYSYYPYSYYGYYPYSYYSGYPYYGSYPYGYNYGYYYSRPPYRSVYANSSIVVRVQTQLARMGYYHGAIDGVIGARTRAAVRAYERTHGLPVDGVITGRLTAAMDVRY